MAAKKRSRSKDVRAKQAAPAAGRFSIVLATAARSAVNMTVTAITSGSVLVCLFAAKRLFDARLNTSQMATQDYELHTATFCDCGDAGNIRFCCGSQQRLIYKSCTRLVG